MVRVENNNISMTRGDSLSVLLSVTRDGAPYALAEGDAVEFFLKHNVMNSTRTAYRDAQPVIQKTIPNESLLLALEPEDTKPLPFGEYVYDIQLTFANGAVDTIINNAVFRILPEVG